MIGRGNADDVHVLEFEDLAIVLGDMVLVIGLEAAALGRRVQAAALDDAGLDLAIPDVADGGGLDALLGVANPARTALDTVVAYEKGEWDTAVENARELGISPDSLPDIYADALRWSRELSQLSAA